MRPSRLTIAAAAVLLLGGLALAGVAAAAAPPIHEPVVQGIESSNYPKVLVNLSNQSDAEFKFVDIVFEDPNNPGDVLISPPNTISIGQ
jgi:hypothetical protein